MKQVANKALHRTLTKRDRAGAHQLHKFRVAMVRYKNVSHKELGIREGAVVLEAQTWI